MKKYRKNSRKNPWKSNTSLGKRKMPWLRIIAFTLIIAVPVTAICLTNTIVTRVPDIYSYNLRSTEILDDLTTAIDEDSLVALMSGYMQMKTDVFQLKENVEYEPKDLFSDLDQMLMYKFRKIENIFGALGILGLLVIIAAYIILIRMREKELLMSRFKWGCLVYAIAAVTVLLITVLAPLRSALIKMLLGRSLPDGDMLVQIFGGSLSVHLGLIALLASAVAIILMAYCTNYVAGHKKMFKKY